MECDELTEPQDQPQYDDDPPEDDEWGLSQSPIRAATRSHLCGFFHLWGAQSPPRVVRALSHKRHDDVILSD